MIKNFKNLVEKGKKILQKIIKTKKTAHETALGFAIGTFIAILPTPGLNIILTIIIALFYKRINKLTLFGALAFWNPLFMAPVYILSATIGKAIINATGLEFGFPVFERLYLYLYKMSPEAIKESLRFTYKIGIRYLFGSIILSVIISILSYFLVKKLSEQHKKRVSEKIEKKRKKELKLALNKRKN